MRGSAFDSGAAAIAAAGSAAPRKPRSVVEPAACDPIVRGEQLYTGVPGTGPGDPWAGPGVPGAGPGDPETSPKKLLNFVRLQY